MRKPLSLGSKDVEVLHIRPESFEDDKGKTVTMFVHTVLIETVSSEPLTVWSPVSFQKGKQKLSVFVTGKAKGELKFQLKNYEADANSRGGKAV